jgi:putative transferase (TIGR04331 family)
VNQIENKIKFKKFDQKLRLKINLNSDNKPQNFENFIRYILPSSLPITVIESFKDINKLSITSDYPKTPKFIFTSGAYAYDEVFKFFVARKVDEGVPYYVGQHGNNYFTAICFNHMYELKTCDKFISWGGKYESNVVPAFNFKTLGKKRLFKKDGNLTVICDTITLDPYQRLYELEQDREKKVQSISSLIVKLNNEIKKKTKIRLHESFYNSSRGLYYKKYFEDTGVEIDNGKKEIEKLLINTKVSLFTYDSTGILENLSLNMPTLCFLDNDLQYINERNIEDYNLLIDANILFMDKNKLIDHLTKYWADIEKWWLDEKTQLNVNKFNSKLNKPGDKNSIRNLANILKN